jgi:hypothetical protein
MIKYKCNPEMEYIELDETEQVIHDNITGDIHYLNNISGIIIKQFTVSLSIDDLMKQLFEIFDGDPSEIRSDAEEFVNELIKKHILIETED